MNNISKTIAAVMGSMAFGFLIGKLLKRRSALTKHSNQLANAIDKNIEENLAMLQKAKQLLEQELDKVNLAIEKSNS